MNRSDNLAVTAILVSLTCLVTGCLTYDFRDNPFLFWATLTLGIGMVYGLGWNAGRYYSK